MLKDVFNVTLLEYLINFLIFSQTLFFMWLYEKSIKRTLKEYEYYMIEMLFYIIALIFLVIVICSGFSFNFYKTHLIIQYVALVLLAYNMLKSRYNVLTSISLSFLLVFLNSYYWEMVLHVIEYNINPFSILNLRETFHLVVIPFLLDHYYFNKHVVIRKLAIGIFISFIVSIITVEIIPKYELYLIPIPFFIHLTNVIYFINRLICLVILLNIVINNTLRKKSGKKMWFE